MLAIKGVLVCLFFFSCSFSLFFFFSFSTSLIGYHECLELDAGEVTRKDNDLSLLLRRSCGLHVGVCHDDLEG